LQRTAEEVAERLGQAGFPARAYHAGMKDQPRAEVQDWFMGASDAIVVATIAFGMGVDKADIRYLFHYNIPKSLENYAQEIGRAGRDGQPAICRMLVCPDDLNVLENFVFGDTPDPGAVRSLIRDLFARKADFDVSLYSLSSEHDVRPLVLRTLLTYLELQGFLSGGTPFYAEYRFKPLMASREILARFEGQRRDFLAALFRQARKARAWFHIDPDAAAAAMKTDRQRVIRALDWLGEQQLLEVEASGVRHRYRRLKSPDDPIAVADELHGYMLKREEAEIVRLRQVLDLVRCNGCQTAALAAHFGEKMDQPCGHCTWCLSGTCEIPERALQEIPPELHEQARQVVLAANGVLDEPRSLTRFLCGIPSPRLSRAKLGTHPLSGALDRVPFREVLEWASTNPRNGS
jgi:ATP-dependent DNA helicase RecQ